MPLNIYTF